MLELSLQMKTQLITPDELGRENFVVEVKKLWIIFLSAFVYCILFGWIMETRNINVKDISMTSTNANSSVVYQTMSPIRIRMHSRICNQHPRASLCFKGFKTFRNPSSWSQPCSCNKLEKEKSPHLLNHIATLHQWKTSACTQERTSIYVHSASKCM